MLHLHGWNSWRRSVKNWDRKQLKLGELSGWIDFDGTEGSRIQSSIRPKVPIGSAVPECRRPNSGSPHSTRSAWGLMQVTMLYKPGSRYCCTFVDTNLFIWCTVLHVGCCALSSSQWWTWLLGIFLNLQSVSTKITSHSDLGILNHFPEGISWCFHL